MGRMPVMSPEPIKIPCCSEQDATGCQSERTINYGACRVDIEMLDNCRFHMLLHRLGLFLPRINKSTKLSHEPSLEMLLC